MRKVLTVCSIALTLLMAAPSASAQEEAQEMYCEIIGRGTLSLRGKIKIEVDFGQENKVFEGFDSDVLKDPVTGKNMKFNSMVDALNFMSGQGWVFVNAYPINNNGEPEYHYIMKKTVPKQ